MRVLLEAPLMHFYKGHFLLQCDKKKKKLNHIFTRLEIKIGNWKCIVNRIIQTQLALR